jgi:hypothetical protein
MDVPPTIVNRRTLAPLRAICEALGPRRPTCKKKAWSTNKWGFLVTIVGGVSMKKGTFDIDVLEIYKLNILPKGISERLDHLTQVLVLKRIRYHNDFFAGCVKLLEAGSILIADGLPGDRLISFQGMLLFHNGVKEILRELQ